MIYKNITLGDFGADLAYFGESQEAFAKSLQTMIDSAKSDSTEEFQKTLIANFLRENFDYECNVRGKADLAIYDEGKAKVLFEVKSTENKAEFVKMPQIPHPKSLPQGEGLKNAEFSPSLARGNSKNSPSLAEGARGWVESRNDAWNLESKAFYESILYFLREVHFHKNNNIKHIILCTAREFYIIKANDYHALFVANANKAIQKAINTAYKNCDLNQGNDTSTRKFYTEIESILREMGDTLEFCYINIETLLDSTDSRESNKDLALFYALLSPNSLLDIPRYIDANTLNEKFYKELLYILGLKQVETNGKVLIKPDDTPNALLDCIMHTFADKLPNDIDEAFDSHIFPLLMLWNNRILFLRLLESMLLNFKHIEKPFLHIEVLSDFSALSTLFFKVLAIKERESIPQNLAQIPYLNSSLFEKSALESQGFEIALLDSRPLKIAPDSILRRDSAQNAIYKSHDSLPLLEYLFAFLHAYNFTTTPRDIVDFAKINHDKLINSAVLGLVFEKLNGYKEGSFYTPSFITSYMCSQSIRKIVLQKFQAQGYKAQNLTALRNEIDINKLNEANRIFLSISICDPAVGSGHFLVSALNELIAIKHELGLLMDCEGKRLKDIDLSLENDELIIKDSSGVIIDYTIPAHENIESHIIQKALFHTKRELIENCLFGVDINPSSVEICKLRLWIELLKYSYYENIATRELQTLPNIDINIKCGNSLISNFALDLSFEKTQTKEFMQNLKITISDYKAQVALYKEALTNKRTITDKIHALKTLLQNYLIQNSSESKRLIEFLRQFVVEYGESYFDIDTAFGFEMLRIIRQKGREKVAFRFQPTIEQLEPKSLDKNGEILLEKIKAEFYALESLRSGDSFEWRFEFPEVLNENGDFMGFDLIIGNPPYIKEADNKRLFEKTKILRTYQGKMDIWYHFVGKGFDLVKNKHIVTFIATNNWTTNAGAQRLRNVILRESQIINLVDFGAYMCFDSASIQTMIMEFQKSDNIPKSYAITYAKIEAKKPTDSHRDAVLAREIFEDNVYLTPTITPKNLLDKTLNFVDSNKDLVLNKMLQNGKFYFDDSEIQIGIGLTDKVKRRMDLANHKIGEGIFQLSTQELKNLNLSAKEKKLIKPLYTTNELFKFYGNPKNSEWVIYTDSTFKNPRSMDKCPNLKRHLDKFKSVITSDNKPYGLHRAKQERFFNQTPSIVSLRKCPNEPIFTYVDFDCYVTSTFFIIQTSRIDMKYLTGILNSKLIAFWLRYKGKLQGANYQIDKEPLLKIPIIKPNAKNKNIVDKIIDCVDKILESKSKGADSSIYESQIDDLVFKLYNLVSKEIEIIQGS